MFEGQPKNWFEFRKFKIKIFKTIKKFGEKKLNKNDEIFTSCCTKTSVYFDSPKYSKTSGRSTHCVRL